MACSPWLLPTFLFIDLLLDCTPDRVKNSFDLRNHWVCRVFFVVLSSRNLSNMQHLHISSLTDSDTLFKLFDYYCMSDNT
ncbi:hypothetical protein KFK09_029262 [Dendrobium nobile]|uniref:Secreted protein n=1 Tax=Dendrobium nobile TaxID=94219 RepID=A0A8T3A601_DENNO|nr:hypothetical protein KFK09_029262 [Dendrobium nobile]